ITSWPPRKRPIGFLPPASTGIRAPGRSPPTMCRCGSRRSWISATPHGRGIFERTAMGRPIRKGAFINGGGGGIGRATAERFAEEGAKVMIADIDQAAGEAAAGSARERATNRGGDAHFLRCDVTERTSVEAAVQATIARYGKLDILHNNAGGST